MCCYVVECEVKQSSSYMIHDTVVQYSNGMIEKETGLLEIGFSGHTRYIRVIVGTHDAIRVISYHFHK